MNQAGMANANDEWQPSDGPITAHDMTHRTLANPPPHCQVFSSSRVCPGHHHLAPHQNLAGVKPKPPGHPQTHLLPVHVIRNFFHTASTTIPYMERRIEWR